MFISLFIPWVLIEHLLCARHYSSFSMSSQSIREGATDTRCRCSRVVPWSTYDRQLAQSRVGSEAQESFMAEVIPDLSWRLSRTESGRRGVRPRGQHVQRYGDRRVASRGTQTLHCVWRTYHHLSALSFPTLHPPTHTFESSFTRSTHILPPHPNILSKTFHQRFKIKLKNMQELPKKLQYFHWLY